MKLRSCEAGFFGAIDQTLSLLDIQKKEGENPAILLKEEEERRKERESKLVFVEEGAVPNTGGENVGFEDMIGTTENNEPISSTPSPVVTNVSDAIVESSLESDVSSQANASLIFEEEVVPVALILGHIHPNDAPAVKESDRQIRMVKMNAKERVSPIRSSQSVFIHVSRHSTTVD